MSNTTPSGTDAPVVQSVPSASHPMVPPPGLMSQSLMISDPSIRAAVRRNSKLTQIALVILAVVALGCFAFAVLFASNQINDNRNAVQSAEQAARAKQIVVAPRCRCLRRWAFRRANGRLARKTIQAKQCDIASHRRARRILRRKAIVFTCQRLLRARHAQRDSRRSSRRQRKSRQRRGDDEQCYRRRRAVGKTDESQKSRCQTSCRCASRRHHFARLIVSRVLNYPRMFDI